jgi:hypothetical protein
MGVPCHVVQHPQTLHYRHLRNLVLLHPLIDQVQKGHKPCHMSKIKVWLVVDASGIANWSHGSTSRSTWNCPQPETEPVKEHQTIENFKEFLTCQFPQARPNSPFPLTSTTATPQQFWNWSINLHDIRHECLNFLRFASQLNQSGKTKWHPFAIEWSPHKDLLFYGLKNLHHQW